VNGVPLIAGSGGRDGWVVREGRVSDPAFPNQLLRE